MVISLHQSTKFFLMDLILSVQFVYNCNISLYYSSLSRTWIKLKFVNSIFLSLPFIAVPKNGLHAPRSTTHYTAVLLLCDQCQYNVNGIAAGASDIVLVWSDASDIPMFIGVCLTGNSPSLQFQFPQCAK